MGNPSHSHGASPAIIGSKITQRYLPHNTRDILASGLVVIIVAVVHVLIYM